MLTPEQIAESILNQLPTDIARHRRTFLTVQIVIELQRYGDERAAQERERCAQVVDAMAREQRFNGRDIGHAAILETAIAAIRALS